MKQTILLLVIALAFLACEKEDISVLYFKSTLAVKDSFSYIWIGVLKNEISINGNFDVPHYEISQPGKRLLSNEKSFEIQKTDTIRFYYSSEIHNGQTGTLVLKAGKDKILDVKFQPGKRNQNLKLYYKDGKWNKIDL